MSRDEKEVYTAEDILEFLSSMCTRCKNGEREKKLKNYKEQLLIIKNHKIDRITEDIGINL